MAANHMPTVLSGVLIMFTLVFSIRARDYLRLRHIQGPLWAGWTKAWLVKSQLSGRLNLILADLNVKYGPLVRIAPNWVVCSDASELRRIWAVRPPWQRGQWYKGLRIDPYRDNTFTAVDEGVHETLRSKLLPGYAGKNVDNVHELIDEQVADLIRLLETKYLSTATDFKAVDLAQKAQYFTLDVISSLAFGKAFGYLVSDEDKFGYIETTEKTVLVLLATALLPRVLSILQSLRLKSIMPSARGMVGIGTVMSLAQEAVSQRYGTSPIVKRDMLGSFIAHGLSQEDAEGQTIVQIIAGSDTTATAIRSTLFLS